MSITIIYHVTSLSEPIPSGQRVLVIDIDGTLCSNTEGDYSAALPNHSAIRNVNLLFEQGARIVLFTARGSTTNVDWSALTAGQMANWGVRHHELLFGKPFGHFYIDDKAVHAKDLESGKFLSTFDSF